MSISETYKGFLDARKAVRDYGLTEAEAMVDYLMSLDNTAAYGIAFAKAVADARIDSLS